METASLKIVLNDVVKQLTQIETTRSARLASTVLVLYDYVLTFDREVDLIWKGGWHLPKVIFFINRYYAMASAIFSYYVFFVLQLSPKLYVLCFVSSIAFLIHYPFLVFEAAWTGLIGCMLAETILQMRIYALYSQNKRIIRLMLALFLACSMAAAITIGVSLRELRTFPIAIPNGQYCVGVPLPHLYGFWIPILLFESFVCILALIHAYQAYRSDCRGLGLLRAFDNQRFSHILVRDSILYFLAIGAVYFTCLIVWKIDKRFEAPAGFSLAMSSILGSRLILNLREAHAKQAHQYSLDTAATILTMNIPDRFSTDSYNSTE